MMKTLVRSRVEEVQGLKAFRGFNIDSTALALALKTTSSRQPKDLSFRTA